MLPTSQIIQGEEIHCHTEKWHCKACGAEWMSPAQATASVIAAVKTYQRKHGLLTGAELRKRREALDWTQKDLVRHSDVSIATVKRLESGVHVQNKSIDQLISAALDQYRDAYDYVPLVSYTIRQHQQQSESRSVWRAFGQEKVTSPRMEFIESEIYA
jgi:putative zinc finger/helix-turn-helix YgiT family protein